MWINNGLTKSNLFADAEASEDLAEQIVRGELPCDRAQRGVREAQLLGEELPASAFARCRFEVRAGLPESTQMALTREEHRLAARRPAGCLQDRLAQPLQALPGLGRHGERPALGAEAGNEVDLVVHVDARNAGGQVLELV